MGFSIQDYDLRNAFKTERNLLLLSGFYPRRNNKCNFLYNFSASLNLLISYAQLVSMIVQLVVEKNNLSKLAECLLFFATHFTFLCKLTNFGYYRNNLLNIEDTLASSIFYGHPYNQLKLLKTKIASCQLIGKLFRMTCILCILFYLLIPYLGETLKLPLPGWLPYNTTKYFHVTVTFQIVSISVSAYNNSSIDILTWTLITVAAAEFNILKENLKNNNYRKSDYENIDSNVINMYFRNCIKHHIAITNLVYTIEMIFSKGIFLQFFASIVVICFTGFQMIVVPILSIQFVCLMLYFVSMMCQVAMYCWYGHDVMTTSSEIGQSFYLSNWYQSDAQIRKDILIFLERTKKPLTLTAGKVLTLSLTTLTGILRSSYSYFAVLQRLYKDEF